MAIDRTKLRGLVGAMIVDMIEGCINSPDEDFTDEARNLGVTVEEIIAELRRQAMIPYTQNMREMGRQA
jgi:hypothetical protein